ncbi:unnamed protein product [Ilex paraguariensis]|uniref:Conserved oligomeric Golgi complex subunit 3 C-terminal domain-containing protein n=1 Tax=Ilex paraguariensis TaxID=185542 RepID=A0ABC8UZK1_9AQUA
MATPKASLPKSEAISKGYNFASTWEQGAQELKGMVCDMRKSKSSRFSFKGQSAPLTEQQQAAIGALSHAVAERPFPANLAPEHISGQDKGLCISTKHSNVEESGAVETVLVNTNQFYKWFMDLEAAMKSEAEEKYQCYVNTLTDRIQKCDGILYQVDETLDLFNDLQLQHQAVATKTKTLHDACDRLLLEKQRLIEFAESLRSKLNYFDELENIANYVPFDDDLDYPTKLERSAEMKSETAASVGVLLDHLNYPYIGCVLWTDQSPDVFKTWYPPLEKTLSCLSKLDRCLEPPVFTGLAQEAVEVCSLSIQKASKLIVKKSSPMDGQLFLIKHLLILREQDLEKSLKATCEEFIMSVTKLVVDPMLSFVTKVTAVKVAFSSGSQNQKLESVLAKPLKDQAFATPDKVGELVQKLTLWVVLNRKIM